MGASDEQGSCAISGGVGGTESDRRKTWKRSFDYLFNICGLMIGLGNIWRFPYLCYKNGGGAFLVAYIIFIVGMIFPLFVLESALGQYTSSSAARAWCIVPLFKGIGYAVLVLVAMCNLFYPMLLAWALRWLIASFSGDLPWMNCNNAWNSENCIRISLDQGKFGKGENASMLHAATPANRSGPVQSSVEEFWRDNILELSSGVEDLGGMKWDNFACFVAIWVLTYFAIWKGINWTTKIVYVTATLPIIILIVIIIRGVTLDGAMDGLAVFLRPDVSKLADVQVWTDAASQVLYSFGTATGSVTTLSGYNKFHNNFLRDSVVIVCVNALASFLSGLAIFSVLGFLANAKGCSVADVAESGPGLIFVVYPTALSLLPMAQFWCALSFFTIILMGFDSMFVFHENGMACMRDIFPRLFRRKYSYEVVLAIVCAALLIFGVPLATRGGMYVLEIFNSYSVSGWCLYFMAFCEYVAIGWCYGTERMQRNIHQMIGIKIPLMCLNVLWRYTGPLCAMVLMIYSLSSYRPLTYDRDYIYPVWANVFGWMTALSSTLWIPTTAVYEYWKADGRSMSQKFKNAIEAPAYLLREMPYRSEKKTETGDEMEFQNLKSCV